MACSGQLCGHHARPVGCKPERFSQANQADEPKNNVDLQCLRYDGDRKMLIWYVYPKSMLQSFKFDGDMRLFLLDLLGFKIVQWKHECKASKTSRPCSMLHGGFNAAGHVFQHCPHMYACMHMHVFASLYIYTWLHMITHGRLKKHTHIV